MNFSSITKKIEGNVNSRKYYFYKLSDEYKINNELIKNGFDYYTIWNVK